MTVSAPATPTREIPTDAHCIGCGYALRDLPEHRCPECGRAFDPTRPWTLDLLHRRRRTQFLEWLAEPMGVGVRRAMVVACGMILWGAAWLPGAFYVFAVGWLVLLAMVVYRIIRRVARRMARARRGQPQLTELPLSEQFAVGHALLVALAMSSSLYDWPLRLNVLVHRPLLDRYAHHVYAERPILNPPSTPRMVGLFIVTANQADVHGTSMTVFAAGKLYWCADEPKRPFGWYVLGGEIPWYLRWAIQPAVGPWFIRP